MGIACEDINSIAYLQEESLTAHCSNRALRCSKEFATEPAPAPSEAGEEAAGSDGTASPGTSFSSHAPSATPLQQRLPAAIIPVGRAKTSPISAAACAPCASSVTRSPPSAAPYVSTCRSGGSCEVDGGEAVAPTRAALNGGGSLHTGSPPKMHASKVTPSLVSPPPLLPSVETELMPVTKEESCRSADGEVERKSLRPKEVLHNIVTEGSRSSGGDDRILSEGGGPAWVNVGDGAGQPSPLGLRSDGTSTLEPSPTEFNTEGSSPIESLMCTPPHSCILPDSPHDDEMPSVWMDEIIPRNVWEKLGLDVAPFTVQASAPMHLVHFYFSQLTLNCVFVVDRGRFVGMINKADMVNSNF
mmetsp:Transcript_66296/g.131450  ORF Transcript_66296/g.131450 Transcript_66296/m.131450 type:complete len:358 (-) Transcript_66296:189-1262(-)